MVFSRNYYIISHRTFRNNLKLNFHLHIIVIIIIYEKRVK